MDAEGLDGDGLDGDGLDGDGLDGDGVGGDELDEVWLFERVLCNDGEGVDLFLFFGDFFSVDLLLGLDWERVIGAGGGALDSLAVLVVDVLEDLVGVVSFGGGFCFCFLGLIDASFDDLV